MKLMCIQGQRRVEVIAPPATYPRSRVSQAMLGRLHMPSPSPSSRGNPVIRRSLFDSASGSAHPLPPARIASNGYATSPLTPVRQSNDHRQPREHSPPINPPGSIFGRHELPPRRSDNPVHAPREQGSPSRPTNGHGEYSQNPRYTSHTASSRPVKEASPRDHSPGHGSTINNDMAENIATILASTIRDAIATQMAAYTQGLRPQGIRNTPPRTPRPKGNKHNPFRTPAKSRSRTQMRQEMTVRVFSCWQR